MCEADSPVTHTVPLHWKLGKRADRREGPGLSPLHQQWWCRCDGAQTANYLPCIVNRQAQKPHLYCGHSLCRREVNHRKRCKMSRPSHKASAVSRLRCSFSFSHPSHTSFSTTSTFLLSVGALSVNDGIGSLSAAIEQRVLAFFPPADPSHITIYCGITQGSGRFPTVSPPFSSFVSPFHPKPVTSAMGGVE